jgi:hypothetical protein
MNIKRLKHFSVPDSTLYNKISPYIKQMKSQGKKLVCKLKFRSNNLIASALEGLREYVLS